MVRLEYVAARDVLARLASGRGSVFYLIFMRRPDVGDLWSPSFESAINTLFCRYVGHLVRLLLHWLLRAAHLPGFPLGRGLSHVQG